MNEPAKRPRSPLITAANGTHPVASDATDFRGSAGVGVSALKLAVVAPSHADKALTGHAMALAHHLAQAGHDVTLVSWSRPFPVRRSPEARAVSGAAGAVLGAPEVPAFPRTVRALSWARPDTWVRTGRRLQRFDAIVLMHLMPLEVPAHLAMLRAAGVGGAGAASSGMGAPRAIVIAHNVMPKASRPGDRALMRSLFERVDAVMVHSPDQARLAHDLHAARISVANPVQVEPPRGRQPVQPTDLSSRWAHYVGVVEALASPHWQAAEEDSPERSQSPSFLARRVRMRMAAPMRQMLRRRRSMMQSRRPMLSMTRVDLPEWVRPSDVLSDGADADDARDWARSFGLPRCSDPIAAWSALGALAAIVRLLDDGHRSAVIVDGSGVRSPLSKWARAIGFAPVELDVTGDRSSVAGLDVDTASLDVITRLHPNGCDSQDVDEALSEASWALRPGGLISLTLPLGPATADGAVGRADVRAVLARAHALGFVLVGDLDADLTGLMRAASEGERRSDAAYALVRLTFRRL